MTSGNYDEVLLDIILPAVPGLIKNLGKNLSLEISLYRNIELRLFYLMHNPIHNTSYKYDIPVG